MLLNRYTAALALITALAFSCTEKEEQTPIASTRLRVKAQDNASNGVGGAQLSLYNNMEDWAKEQNPVQITTTDANGWGWFMYLDESSYYITASKGNLSNWESEVLLTGIEPNKQNDMEINLKEFRSNYLASAAGKTWRVVAYSENNVSMIDDSSKTCITDNSWTFYKGSRAGQFTLNEGDSTCFLNMPQQTTGTWELSSNNDFLKITLNGQPVAYFIEYSSPTTIRINRNAGTTLIKFTLQTN